MREISKEKYIYAFIITAGIFLLGLFLGLIIENQRVDYVENQYHQQRIVLGSSQLQYDLLTEIQTKNNCPAIYKAFNTNLKDLETTRIRLENFNENAILDKDSFALIERDYLLAQVRYWMLARKTQNVCNNDVVTILNFYKNKEECPECDNQNFILTYLKKLFGDKLLIFSFKSEITEEPILGILQSAYNVTEYPSIVINDKEYSGFTEKEQLLKTICSLYKEKTEGCEDYQK